MAISSMDVGPVVNVDVVEALRRLESEVIVAWCSSLSETSDGGLHHHSGILHNEYSIIYLNESP